jgi:uncharacterized protein
MDQSHIIKATAQWAETKMSGETTGHDWWHTWRVWKTSMKIQAAEGGNSFIVQMAALLHDIGDHKFFEGVDKTRETALYWMEQFTDISFDDKQHIADICQQLSFKGAEVNTNMPSIEGKIVQDADRLDALGAIGIARAFAYGGKKNRMLYDPSVKPVMHTDFESYKKATGTTINHFYEKLLLLSERMQTNTGKNIAERRTCFLGEFLDTFFSEWDCKDF